MAKSVDINYVAQDAPALIRDPDGNVGIQFEDGRQSLEIIVTPEILHSLISEAQDLEIMVGAGPRETAS